MKIGLIPINVGFTEADTPIAIAQHAERHGVESVWTFEHVMVPVDYQSRYPYSGDGKMGIGADTPFIDPLIALTSVAAHTKRLRLGTGVNILPQSNPLLLAKQAASLDVVSGGRLMLGLGIGWLREEYVAMGVPFEQRGARFDDYLLAMQKVWRGEVVEHQSEFLQWTNFQSLPRPLQSGGVPIVIGGAQGKALERVARFGNGWFAPTNKPEQLAPLLEELRRVCREQGRDIADIEITSMWTCDGGLDQVRRFAELGVNRLIVPLFTLPEQNPMDGISRLADTVIARL